MATVTVYRFKAFDITTGELVLSPSYATREAVERHVEAGELLEDTGRQVPASALDGNGFVPASALA